MSGYALHPEAYTDLDEIRDYIAQDNPDAAGRVITEIFDGIRLLVAFRIRAIAAQASQRARCGLRLCGNMSSPTLRIRNRCGLLRYFTDGAVPA